MISTQKFFASALLFTAFFAGSTFAEKAADATKVPAKAVAKKNAGPTLHMQTQR